MLINKQSDLLIKVARSKLIFARAYNDNLQYDKLQSQTIANGHQNIVCIIKEVRQVTFVR